MAQADISSAAGQAISQVLAPRFGGDRTCRAVIDDAGLDAIDDELAYFALLDHWFLEGRPAHMDIDRNGLPCETLFSAGVVDAVWAGGPIGPIVEINPDG